MTSHKANPTLFTDFQFKEELMQSIQEAGFISPTPIQELAIPVILEGRDVIAQAHTGTGKTAAFGLPCLNAMELDCNVNMLVLSPTRELAQQTCDELYRFGKHLGIRVGTVCGGKSYNKQRRMIEKGVHILCATPGRMLDLLNNRFFAEFAPNVVVLDEADEMLDMGFLEDINAIFDYLPRQRQTLMFSATMPPSIIKLAEKILYKPAHLKTINPSEEKTNKNIEQSCFVIDEHERTQALVRYLHEQDPEKAIIFCKSRDNTRDLTDELGEYGFSCRSLHGEMEQFQRQETMNAFRKGRFKILVATDVAARGLDIDGISHVINYHLPFDAKSYVHRIGRTGRAGNSGHALTLVTPKEFYKIERFQRQVGSDIELLSVPSLLQLRQSRLKKLVKTLKNIQPDQYVCEMAQELREKYNWHDLSDKLFALLIQNWQEIGPDIIGIPATQFQSLLAETQANKKKKRKSDKRSDKAKQKPEAQRHSGKESKHKSKEKSKEKSGSKPKEKSKRKPKNR